HQAAVALDADDRAIADAGDEHPILRIEGDVVEPGARDGEHALAAGRRIEREDAAGQVLDDEHLPGVVELDRDGRGQARHDGVDGAAVDVDAGDLARAGQGGGGG